MAIFESPKEIVQKSEFLWQPLFPSDSAFASDIYSNLRENIMFTKKRLQLCHSAVTKMPH